MIIRRKIEHGYTVIPRAAMEDKRLSYEARGLLAYILVKPNDWRVHVADLCKNAGPKAAGRERVYRILNELKAAGYVTYSQPYGDGHRALAGEYIVTDTAPETMPDAVPEVVAEVPQSGFPDAEVPDAGFPDAGNPTAYEVLTSTHYEVDQTSFAPIGADTSPSAPESTTKPVKAKSPRQRKPMFDAFKAAFPGAHPSKADEFDRATVQEGLTVEHWHTFMDLPESRKDYPRYLTKMNALDRFIGWHRSIATTVPTREAPEGAPPNWADIVYTHDGTRRYPALALPRLGLEPYAPPSEWPTWYQQFEGVQS